MSRAVWKGSSWWFHPGNRQDDIGPDMVAATLFDPKCGTKLFDASLD